VVTAAALCQTNTPQGLAAIDRILTDAVDHGDTPGAVVVVADKDRILYSGAAGAMNTARKQALTVDAIFRRVHDFAAMMR
jgi:CubicO group peptidase (beta-lactamase class C family)